MDRSELVHRVLLGCDLLHAGWTKEGVMFGRPLLPLRRVRYGAIVVEAKSVGKECICLADDGTAVVEVRFPTRHNRTPILGSFCDFVGELQVDTDGHRWILASGWHCPEEDPAAETLRFMEIAQFYQAYFGPTNENTGKRSATTAINVESITPVKAARVDASNLDSSPAYFASGALSQTIEASQLSALASDIAALVCRTPTGLLRDDVQKHFLEQQHSDQQIHEAISELLCNALIYEKANKLFAL